MATAMKLCRECFHYQARDKRFDIFSPSRGWHVCWNLEECECDGPHYEIVPSRDKEES